MKKLILVTGYLLLVTGSFAQTVTQKLQKAWQQFETDPQLKHAISSLYVIDAKTGKVVFDKNSQLGLAPASTQKIITAATAFELLGKDYRYKTELGYDGEIDKYGLNGDLYIFSNGDPTFGSWRYNTTKEEKIFNDFTDAIIRKGIKKISGKIEAHASEWETQYIPDGWIWQDIGNYYGAGARGINWRENQFDIKLESGNKLKEPVNIKNITPELWQTEFVSEVKSAEKNTGDNAFVYLPLNSRQGYIRGTIPIEEKSFKISGAIPDPQRQLVYSFAKYLSIKNPGVSYILESIPDFGNFAISEQDRAIKKTNVFFAHYSPSLDSIIYWFLKKSINLYGEALIKTFAYEKKGFGSTDSGVAIVKDFWKQKGIDEDELNIKDGSGLSPLNRVTTHVQVEILKYAKTKNWFPYFYDALPEYNGMKIKSGTISDVKGYCGYHKAKDGNEYIFSFLVNNYNGPSSAVVNKMYKLLDLLK